MKIRHLLVVAAAAAAVANVSAAKWNLVIQQPNLNNDITEAYQLETMRISADYGLAATDVMPKYVDEDGVEIIGSVDSSSDPSWGEYNYAFNLADFKANGEYKIVLPEGLLKNEAGELSEELIANCTVEVPELAAAMFDDFKVLSVFPDFSEPQAIWDNQLVKINTNHNDAIGLTKLFVTDNTTGESVTISSNFTVGRKLGDPSEISWTIGSAAPFKFYEGHQYTAEFVFFNGLDEYSEDGFPTPVVARQSYEFTGKVEGYKYSDLTLLSIDPAPLTLTISEPSQAVFTYTFSGPVNVYQAETPQGLIGKTVYPASCLSSNDDKTVWTLDLSDNDYVKTVDTELVILVYARDLEGYQLKGNFGEEGESCFEGVWSCDIGAESIVVVTPKSGETLDALTEVVVKSESGEPMKYNWMDVTIQDLLGETLGTLVVEGDGTDATEFRFTKWMPADSDSWTAEPLNIVEEGSYVIYFPTSCFVFGEEYSQKNSRSVYSGFQITGNLDDTPDNPGIDPAEQETLELTETNPAAGSTVESLQNIRLTFAENIGLNGGDVTVYNAANEIVTTGFCDLDWDYYDVVIVKLNEEITADGTYEVVIPARSIISDDFEEGQAGVCNPEIRLNYTIGAGAAEDPQETLKYVSVFPETTTEVETLDQIVLKFGQKVDCDPFVVNVYNVAREAVATGTGRMDFMDQDRVVVTLDEAIVTAGRYEVVIPNHVIIDFDYFESEGKAGHCNPEFRLYYTVAGTGSGDDPVNPGEQNTLVYTSVTPENGSTIGELSEVSLIFPEVVTTIDDMAWVYDANNQIAATASVSYDWDNEYLINVTLPTPIKEDGEYTIVILPETICSTEYADSDGAKGVYNPEIRLTYTVDSTLAGVDSVEDAVNCDVYDVQGRLVIRNASAADLKTLEKGIYVVGGKKFVVR